MKVPFFEAKTQMESMFPEYEKIFQQLLKENHFILGKNLEQFEQNFAQYCGAKFALGVGNGLDAITLSLKAAEVGAGDNVIVPGHTFIASALAVLQAGAVPIFVDVDEYFHLDAEKLGNISQPNVKAVLPVHLYGLPADMEKINSVAKAKSWLVIEDNAQAQGAKFQNKKTGSLGDIAATSFYPTKNLGALGDGGAVTTNSEKLIKNVSLLRNYGQREKYDHVVAGTNSRLDEMQAAFLNLKLKHLDDWNLKRARIAAIYTKELGSVGDLVLPKVRKDCTHVYHLYVVRTKKSDALMNYLKENEVQALVHYPKAMHQHEAMKNKFKIEGDLKESEQICKEVLSLPIFPEISASQVEYVIQKIKEFYKKN